MWGPKITWFKEDNRTFSLTAETYRSKAWGKALYYSDGNTTHQYAQTVSPTTAYDANYNALVTLTATDNYFNAITNALNPTNTDYTVYHKVGNPFAAAGGEIDYEMNAKTWRNGFYAFVGQHDRAPAHELYIQIDNGASNLQLFAHPNEGFDYLGAPSTLSRSYNISN
ncbi:DUF3238 domain-containing protein [Paenibacillus sp. MMS18-CY102]|uniref:DUF3238 domain-containing protein n=1 Tax=Paenibacillus sp. MMS18-CY102 TaxID=2682849 RepID=UPI0013660983|nr:DUF3238 domain-containing protein [Paenibacillus sp. MMS18-CY102]